MEDKRYIVTTAFTLVCAMLVMALAKAIGIISWSWFIVFCPVILPIALTVVVFCLTFCAEIIAYIFERIKNHDK